MRSDPTLQDPTAPSALTPGLQVAFIAVAAVLVVTSVISITNLRNVYHASDAVARSYAVGTDLEGLLSTLTDAETGGRGYVITGDEQYLAPYLRARQDIATRVHHAEATTRDDPAQQADLRRVVAAAETKLAEVDEAVELRRRSGFEAARAKVADQTGRRSMDQIRTTIDRMEARENALLAERIRDAARSYQLALVARFTSLGVGLSVLVGLYLTTVRYGRDRIQSNRALQDQQAQLRDTIRLKDEFVSVVSHELRTPTNTIAGWARMLADGTAAPERSEKAIATIARNAESLRQLIDDLMDTSLLASGRMSLSVGPVDLAKVVKDAIETVRLSAENKGVILRSELPSGMPVTMIADSGRLTQVVWNLLANAIKFTPPGGHVTVSLQASSETVTLTVVDTGNGINAELLPHVFERFRRDATAGQKGVGLGLAIVRHLVELHGGTVAVESAGIGKGSTFAVRFPVAAVAQTASSPTWSGIKASNTG